MCCDSATAVVAVSRFVFISTMSFNNFSSDDSSSDDEDLTRDFEKEAQLEINEKTLPKKSVDRYNLAYETFMKWKDYNKATSFEENVLICYFKDIQKKVGPATSWSIWSILKKMLNLRHKVDIGQYYNLKMVLKNNSKGYKPKKSLTLTWDQIMQFLNEAPDYMYLNAKILLIFGISGACRCIELTNLKSCDVEDLNDRFCVSISDTKTYIDRSFIIGSMFYSKVKAYVLMRPVDQFTDRFFIQYYNGKCHRQVLGKNKIGSTPSLIASYLNLQDPSKYTGHCFRRTSATLLSNSGANLALVKQLGGWKSDTVAQGYIADSIQNKNIIFQGITHEKKTANGNFEVGPSTNIDHRVQLNSSDGCLDVKKQIDELDLTYDDFVDENFSPNELHNPLELLSHNDNDLPSFKAANGNELPFRVPLRSKNENISCKLFTKKSPVKLSFAKCKRDSVDVQPAKKTKFGENSCSSNGNDIVNNNAGDIEQVQQLTTKDCTVKFENCTITGNITNNHYYYGNK